MLALVLAVLDVKLLDPGRRDKLLTCVGNLLGLPIQPRVLVYLIPRPFCFLTIRFSSFEAPFPLSLSSLKQKTYYHFCFGGLSRYLRAMIPAPGRCFPLLSHDVVVDSDYTQGSIINTFQQTPSYRLIAHP